MRKAVFILLISTLAVSAQRARTDVDGATPASLPNTMDVTPSRGVGPFDAKQAQEWRDAAEVLCAQSRYTEAEKLYSKLLEEREHSLGLNSPDLVADLNDLGRVNFAQMKYQAAITYYERALQIMETAQGQQDFAVVGPLDKLARVYQMLEKYPQAEQYVRRALGSWSGRRLPDAVEAAPELVALGDLLVSKSSFRKPNQHYDRAVKIFEKSNGIATPDLLPALDGIAAADVELHHPAEAEAAWRRALSIRESAFGPSTLEVAETLDRLGRFYFQQKKYPEAAYCYERTLFIRSKSTATMRRIRRLRSPRWPRCMARKAARPTPNRCSAPCFPPSEVELATSVNSLAALLASHDSNSEAESLYKMSISVLDKHGFVASRKPVIDRADPPSPLLAETLDQYAALLKKMRNGRTQPKWKRAPGCCTVFRRENRHPRPLCMGSTRNKYYLKSGTAADSTVVMLSIFKHGTGHRSDPVHGARRFTLSNRPNAEPADFEIVLGRRQLASVLFLATVAIAVFSSFSYLAGNHSPAAPQKIEVIRTVPFPLTPLPAARAARQTGGASV